MRPPIPRLHILTDTRWQSRFSHFELAEMAFSAGNVAVQYRNKDFLPNRDLEELMAIAAMAKHEKKCLIINDDAALAFQVEAQGVHLGKEDGSAAAARQLLGTEALIGATVHDAKELAAALQNPADYLGIGPVFGTRSKETGLPDLGVAGLAALCRSTEIPVIAIGNIRLDNVVALIRAGAYGMAIMSAFSKSDLPVATAKAFIKKIERTIHILREQS